MSKRDDDFSLEHSIVESGIAGAKDFEALELPLSKGAFLLVLIIAASAVLIVFGRIFLLGVWSGDFYQTRAAINLEQPITMPAARGNIYDRFGNLLAQNLASQRVVLNTSLVKRKALDLNHALDSLSEILGVAKSDLEEEVQKSDLEKTALVTLGRNLADYQIELIKKLNFPALEIQDDYRREYLGGPAFSHALGYTGLLKVNDLIGRTGLEKYYEEVLAGSDGLRLMYRDAKGEVFEEKFLNEPKNGEDLYLTIDSGLQKYFYDRLKSALVSLGRDVGVGIALNPQNGEVLAMVNIPSYDNNTFTLSGRDQARKALLQSPLKPLFNRAVSGIYMPGSTIKPLVALAVLKEGVVNPKKQIYSAGYIQIPNPYFP